jgi:hypothetical protein
MLALRRGVRRLPLRGADLVLMARHPRWKGVGLSINTLLMIECDGPIARDDVSRALDRLLDVCPWPAARLTRPFPWGKLQWVAGPRATLSRPPVLRTVLASRDQLGHLLETELNTPIEPRREAPLRIALLDPQQDSGTSFLVLTWFHPLMDARGGQNLVGHLDRADRHEGEIVWNGASPALVPDRDRRPWKERGRIAGSSLKYMKTLAPVPPVSLATTLVPPGRACCAYQSFVAPAAGDQRASREIWWRLALVGKAMAELWQQRGLPDIPFLLPISVDLRRKGNAGPTFGNHLAFHFARFRPSATGDVPGLARALRCQMADALRDGQIDANAVAMEFLQYRPLSTMLRVLPWTTGGELFSFNCADLADWPDALAQCFGRRVVNAYHIPVVPPRPGIGVFFNRCGSRNNVVVSWIEGVVSRDEAARIIEIIRDGMGWTTAQ